MENTLNVGMCRCCASEGTFKDVTTKYHWMGKEEVYGEMLKECFNLTLYAVDELHSGICEVCITQLRNAANFKKQVYDTEEQYRKLLGKQVFDEKTVEIKIESDLLRGDSIDSRDFSDGGDTGDPDFKSDFPLKEEYGIEVPKTRKRAAKPSTSSSKKAKVEKRKSTERTDTRGHKRKKIKKNSDKCATPERVEHRVNLTMILQHSTASPFRDKTAKGFACLYCAKYFKTIQELRTHTAQQNEKNKLNTMIDYKLSYNPIKLDITNLKCNLCNSNMRDLNELKDHLISAHNKKIFKDIKDIILPFRLEDGTNYTCVICSLKHVSFKNLYLHMSSHYRNYCCDQCGTGYITIAALRKHTKTHFQGHFSCDFCDKTYTSIYKKRNHEKGVHTGGWLRNKCPICPEIFVSYYDKNEHLVKAHNAARITFPCNACDKTYNKRYELSKHIANHHLQQKNYLCDKCNANFFSKRGLVDHMAKHLAGENPYTCEVCGKSFHRERALKEHAKTHDENGASYQCEICKKKFVQKCSLKNHVKCHQDDLDIFKEFDDVKHLIDNRDMTLKEIAAESKRKAEEERIKNLLM